MTQEEKDLLIVDLCARLPYGIKGHLSGLDVRIDILGINGDDIFCKPLWGKQALTRDIRYVKPYLRPLSSMAEEETVEYCDLQDKFLLSSQYPVTDGHALFDWLNKKMFDYRGLIEKGLAIAVTEDNNPYKD